LVGAEKEARIVGETYHGPVLVGATATKAAFLDALRRYDVVHFAGHAVVNTSHPESSSLILAPSRGDAGVLSPSEIDGTPIAPGALVVLAACDTAEGSVFRGEGLMGLMRPFIAAGAASVVANLWPLEDEATVEFSAAFHRHVRGGVAPGHALQLVQADFASRRRPAWLWAGWVVIGGYN
jgi:CHAT domain-containing protein